MSKLDAATNIMSLLMSLSAFISVLILLFKVRNENRKILAEYKKLTAEGENLDADTDKHYIETYRMLHDELKASYAEIKELRENQETIICHREYEEHLIRCLRILTAKLVSLSIEVPCSTLSFEEFIKNRSNGNDSK